LKKKDLLGVIYKGNYRKSKKNSQNTDLAVICFRKNPYGYFLAGLICVSDKN
jgi:hypothetical protein